VGDGSPAIREELESAGVEVTGWLSREDVVRQLSSATVVLHTASWEGFPVLLLEAHELGLPILVRRIAAFDHLPDELVGASVEELAGKLRHLLDDPAARAENISRWRDVLQEHTLDHQADRLRRAYATRSAA
jgi:glycosyltransferase involved in cell wall biosynthesis